MILVSNTTPLNYLILIGEVEIAERGLVDFIDAVGRLRQTTFYVTDDVGIIRKLTPVAAVTATP